MIDRLYEELVEHHARRHRQILFLMGPRQVGKTTSCRRAAERFEEFHYLNWDNRNHRETIVGGPEEVADALELQRLRETPPLLVLDEIHKWGKWKDFLKGLFDTYEQTLRIVVTGSARMDVFRSGGDSLMGRYFAHRMHPLSVAELARSEAPSDELIAPPSPIDEQDYRTLWEMGGFPEPFEHRDETFYNRWRETRSQLLFNEDLRELTRIRELGQVELLAEFVRRQVGSTLVYSNLSRDLDASVSTVKRWVETLSRLYYCFAIRPWHKNVKRSLRKRPKSYLWDWSLVDEPGARAENMVGSALLKAVHHWTDAGFGEFDLHFVRDKEQHEVDFAVVRDGEVWFLVEVKTSSTSLSSDLERFRDQTGADHAFQVVLEQAYVDRDCFEVNEPVVVPAETFLSQLV